MAFINKNKPIEEPKKQKSWEEKCLEDYRFQLECMEPFAFRSFNYTEEEDRLYYPFDKIEEWRASKGKKAKPQGMEPDKFFDLCNKEKKYKELKDKIKELEAKINASVEPKRHTPVSEPPHYDW